MKLIRRKHMNKIKCCYFRTKHCFCFKFAEKINTINSFSISLTIVTWLHWWRRGVKGKFYLFRISSFIPVSPRSPRLSNFATITVGRFYISCLNLGLISYLEVRLFQFLLRHTDIIPTKYKEAWKMKKIRCHFLITQYFSLKFTGKTNAVNIFTKSQNQSYGRIHDVIMT